MLNITIEGRPLRIKDDEWFCTVFPNDPNEMPQDFNNYEAAKEYGNKRFGKENYKIESPF